MRIEDLILQWETEQAEMVKLSQIPTEGNGYIAQKNDLILALDIQYQDNQAFIAGVLFEFLGEIKAQYAWQTQTDVPYVPGYFCFREGPPLLDFWHKLLNDSQLQPKLMIIDGHGLAHPRKFGVATWLGIKTHCPTIGCAKETLVHFDTPPDVSKGSFSVIKLNTERVGYVLRNQANINPIFVSPGHLVSLEESKRVILALEGEYRIPEVLRLADQNARAFARGDKLLNIKVL